MRLMSSPCQKLRELHSQRPLRECRRASCDGCGALVMQRAPPRRGVDAVMLLHGLASELVAMAVRPL